MGYGDTWEDWYERVGNEIEPDVETLAGMLQDEGKTSVLDVGCGAGRHMLYLAKQGYDVEGFDQSESAVNQVRDSLNRLDLSGEVVQHDMAEPFPHDTGSFDAVLAIRSIHHVV